MESDDINASLFAALSALPLPGVGDEMRLSIACAIKEMTVYRILELRQRIVADLDSDIPAVADTLDLIDGQLVLRELGGDAGWR